MVEEEFFSKAETAETIAVSSINTVNNEGVLYTNEKTAVRTPLEYKDDYFITVRASEIKKARRILIDNRKVDSRIFEILLAVTFMCFGTFFGSFFSTDVLFDSTNFKTIFSTIFMPIIGVGSAVGAFFTRKISIVERGTMIDKLLECLIDPDKIEQEEQNEYK